jgi:hypothetical protein
VRAGRRKRRMFCAFVFDTETDRQTDRQMRRRR